MIILFEIIETKKLLLFGRSSFLNKLFNVGWVEYFRNQTELLGT
jgi:hypothetical protein